MSIFLSIAKWVLAGFVWVLVIVNRCLIHYVLLSIESRLLKRGPIHHIYLVLVSLSIGGLDCVVVDLSVVQGVVGVKDLAFWTTQRCVSWVIGPPSEALNGLVRLMELLPVEHRVYYRFLLCELRRWRYSPYVLVDYWSIGPL